MVVIFTLICMKMVQPHAYTSRLSNASVSHLDLSIYSMIYHLHILYNKSRMIKVGMVFNEDRLSRTIPWYVFFCYLKMFISYPTTAWYFCPARRIIRIAALDPGVWMGTQ